MTNPAIAREYSERAKRIWGVDLEIDSLVSELRAIYEKEKD